MRWVSVFSGVALLMSMAFFGGIWTGYKGTWPMSALLEIKPYVRSLRETGMLLRDLSYHRRRPGIPDESYTAYIPELVPEGYLFVAKVALPEHMTVAQLIGSTGEVVHEWNLSYTELIDPSHSEVPAHDVMLMPDGSVIANFDDAQGLVRVSACGEPLWSRRDAFLHHSLARDEAGGIWTWESQGSAAAQNQKLIRFDEETGDTLESIDLLDDVIRGERSGFTPFALPEGYSFEENTGYGDDDIFHPNDLEPLPSAMAAAFPAFDAGDLLISMRSIHMIAVIGRQDHLVKWAAYGPWRDQHDPDFQPDGSITVFSNNVGRRRSEVLRFVPGIFESISVVPAELPFFSGTQSKHQITADGNLLVISTWGGRVIEFAPDGRAIRQSVNILDSEYSANVTAGEAIAPGYLEAELPLCAGQ